MMRALPVKRICALVRQPGALIHPDFETGVLKTDEGDTP
jgi:hypothetical protein